MKNITIISFLMAGLAIVGCKKDNNNTATNDNTLEQNVLNDFANVLVNPNYQDIQAKALIMNNAVIAFNANSTDDNLAAVRTAWKNTRAAWESM